MVGGPLFATAVVEVLIGALVEALSHRCWLWVVVVQRGVVRPMVPVPKRPVWHRQAARVAMPQLGGTQRDDIAAGGLQQDLGRPWVLDRVLESHHQGGQGPGYAMDLVAPCFRDRIVHLEADAMFIANFPEHPGGLGAHGGRAVVDERAHDDYRRLLALCRHPGEPQGPVVLQAVLGGFEGVWRSVNSDLNRDVVQVARGVRVVSDEGGKVLRRSRGGPGHGTLRVTRTSKQAGEALRSQGHHYARVM